MSTEDAMCSDMRWRINIRNMATQVKIGIYPHEHAPQRVIINGTIEWCYPARPKSIEECISYEHVHRLAVLEWPQRPHVGLLETYLVELLEYVFTMDHRVEFARFSLCKPEAFKEAEAVGVEAEWTRADFKRLAMDKP